MMLSGKEKVCDMKRTFFVLDFDGTYDMEHPDDEFGVPPVVYLVPENYIHEVEQE